jgi:hypothetical protein
MTCTNLQFWYFQFVLYTAHLESIQTFCILLPYSLILKWIKLFFPPHQSTHNTPQWQRKNKLFEIFAMEIIITITALTVDQGNWQGRNLTNWLVGKVSSYATLKVTELFSKAIRLTMFGYGDCLAVCSLFIHLSKMGMAEVAEFTNLKGCPHTLYI